MKIVRITLLSAVSLILSASCSKMDDIKSDEGTVRNVRELGSPVTNPTHSEWCKPETAEKTLSSVRHIADNFYKMNFLTDLHLKELEEGNYLTYFDFEQAFSNYMFKPEGTEPIEDPAGTACSGFICRNENGEILLGRNFDGMEGPLMLIYNTVNGFKPVMTEMEALQCLQGGAFGIEILNELTDWSCVYNPKQKTVLFALRNDMSKIYKVDLNTDFNKKIK